MKKLYLILILAFFSACATRPEKRYNLDPCDHHGGLKHPLPYDDGSVVLCHNGDILLDGSLLFKGKK
jgi:hypothetical protein